jgi:hypothetical protein
VARGALIWTATAFLVTAAPPLSAQGVELVPFTGYRVGGDVFDAIAVTPVDVDRSPSVGLLFDVPLGAGTQVEGLFSHQQVSVLVAPYADGPPVRLHGAVDHWQAGGLQEYGTPAVRPFLTGTLGLTRYALEADNEVRFTVGAGGGVKLYPTRHAGVRLDARVFSTFLDAFVTSGICGSRGCALALHLNVAWQLELTAAVVVKIGQGE